MPTATAHENDEYLIRDIEDYCPRCANKQINNGKCQKCGFKVYWHV